MSNIYGFTQQDNVARASDGTSVGIRATRDGALLQIPWIQALCLEGRVFGIQCGDGTLDPVGAGAFGVGVNDLDEFDYLHTIPDTVAILPIYYSVGYTVIGTAGEAGIALGWGTGGVINGGIAANTIFNLKPASSNTSSCTVATLGDDVGTVITLAGMIYHNISTALTGVAGTPAQFVPPYSIKTTGFVPVLEGALQMAGFSGGVVAPAGYITSYWVELPISAIQ